jgi:shikimate kinase
MSKIEVQAKNLSSVLWIGGATDSGKTTISRILGQRYGFPVYHYDKHDLPQIKQLALSNPEYRAFLEASLDRNWVEPEPEDLVRRALTAFRDRFPLVIEDLVATPEDSKIIAEGFGLTPELVAPLLLSKQQAIWLIPTEEFKRASVERRNKPSFKDKVTDPDRATKNIITRDLKLADIIRKQAESLDLATYLVDGSRSSKEMAEIIKQHFKTYLSR